MGSCFEPWAAERAVAWQTAFQFGPPEGIGPEAVADWESARDRAERQAGWLLWGSGMAKPCVALALDGEPAVFDERRLIARFPAYRLEVESPVGHEHLARRAAVCVNFCKGVDLSRVGHDSLIALVEELERRRNAEKRREIDGLFASAL